MAINTARSLELLKRFDFQALFIDELGWDRYSRQLEVAIDGQLFTATAFAEKKGVQIFACGPGKDGRIPDRALCRRIDKEVGKTAHERLIIFFDGAKTNQFWLWVSKEPGKPACYRGHDYNVRQNNYLPLLRKLEKIAFTLSDEEALSIMGVTIRLKDAFDRERLAKRFYDYFKAEHKAFLDMISGIPDGEMQRWYASVMISRLMFIYFIQENRFLDNDPRYLGNRLERSVATEPDRYYRDFLCPLFFEGFAKQERPPEIVKKLGKVPYLNGGLFTRHQIEAEMETQGREIVIPDSAFRKLFAFFDGWNWRLDERSIADGREINPDVLGYIFEKYINQKQMGAYYTKEDITGYIGKNTIIPFLFDVAQKKCRIAFEGEQSVWRLLQSDPDRYLYEAVKRGVVNPDGSVIAEDALPDFVQAGMRDPKARMFDRRYNLGPAVIADAAGNNLALPTETWREYAERRKRCLDLREKLARGECRSINDLITHNLDIRQFAQDVIESCEGPELLRAFWHAIVGRMPDKHNENFESGITILDPTCGSGAFLFAALNILEPLYEACLDRMESFVAEHERNQIPPGPPLSKGGDNNMPVESPPFQKGDSGSAESPPLGKGDSGGFNHSHTSQKFSDFRRELARVDDHTNHRYFIMKSIIVNNLYGVDIMDEAVEICKLRLFLKLVAQVEKDDSKPNFGIEPLPDIDFNIRTGNTLVGFAAREEVKEAVTHAEAGQMKLLMGEDDTLRHIEEMADIADRAFKRFRQQQTQHGATPQEMADAKAELKRRLRDLENELNLYLAREYGVKTGANGRSPAFDKWLKSHQPFHWFIEFYGIMKQGGFDVIIGNPPYLELREIDYTLKGFKTLDTAAVHAMCMERSEAILKDTGCMSMIVPLALVSTQRMQVVQEILEQRHSAWYANYSWRPGKLFDTVNRALTIFVIKPDVNCKTYTTNYQKWNSESRDLLMANLAYIPAPRQRTACWVPKLGSQIEESVLLKVAKITNRMQSVYGRSDTRVYYRTTGGLYWKVFTDFAPAFSVNGTPGHSTRETWFTLAQPNAIKPTIAALSSDIFWWWYTVTSNCRDLNPYDVQNFPCPLSAFEDDAIRTLGERYLADLVSNSTMLARNQRQTGRTETQSFKIQRSKPIINEIDQALAKHYNFTDEELDFIINYDIKYRLGSGAGEGDGDE
ncbi:MAG: hypothetical protein WA140_08725 [Geobacteraceae bacterium]